MTVFVISLSSNMSQINNGGGDNGPLMEELILRRDSLNGEKQKDAETREPDAADGTLPADVNFNRRGSTEKKSIQGTIQRKAKQKVGTLSKGGNKLKRPVQSLFNQGVPEKTSEERVQLDLLKQHLEALSLPPDLKWKWEQNNGSTLEKEWTDLVASHATMAKMQRNQQAALWEFISTELSYINKLKIIKDLVIAALVFLHQRDFLQEVTPELLFSNLPSILQAHQQFWLEVLYPMLQEVRRTGKPFDPTRLEPGCLQFHERFSAYHDYCWEEENNLEFTRRQMESNPLFNAFVQWVEDQPQCERMRLGDMQAKPHQRITKYPLLLKSVLENTQQPHMELTLRAMLSSVNRFLEGINHYMQVKDDEYALSISAQRVEGYEVEGINEEIDKLVREICQFDLTCSISGVGSEVIRKLLLEENLKVRGRKDSKLELVALLFSDVLLLTKVQKKVERLKVARPPLALDRTSCVALKDGNSFALVEVGELKCAMNVIILVASSPERCSLWVSSIQQAKENLMNLREQEKYRVDSLKELERKTKPAADVTTNDTKPEEKPPPPPPPPKKTLMDELNDVLKMNLLLNGFAEPERTQSSEEVPANDTGGTLRNSPRVSQKSGQKTNLGRKPAFKGLEWIEMARRDQVLNKFEDEDKIIETPMVMWKYVGQNSSRVNPATPNKPAEPLRLPTARPPKLPDEIPDIDYPTDEENTLKLPNKPQISTEKFLKPSVDRKFLLRSNSDLQLVTSDIRRSSLTSQSGDLESLEVRGFPQNLKSPVLRKRRPGSTNPSPANQTSKPFSQDLGQSVSASNSSSNSDSDCNSDYKRISLPVVFVSDSQQAPKVGPKPSQPNKGASTDVRNVSESTEPEVNPQISRPSLRGMRSASSPNMLSDGRLPVTPTRTYQSPQEEDPPGLGFNSTSYVSPVEGLLERAKERGKSGIKRDMNPASPRSNHQARVTSNNPSPSPTPSDEDRNAEEGEVGIRRRRALTVSTRWKEQLVDGDEDDRSTVFLDGENVDWPGWCFDDEEVLNYLSPRSQGLPEGSSRSPANWVHLESHDDGECSQV
ncbi:uncharacterized protein plekhg6 isoform X1 [Nothobranchius furzeri]